jgi:hypothetical protein
VLPKSTSKQYLDVILTKDINVFPPEKTHITLVILLIVIWNSKITPLENISTLSQLELRLEEKPKMLFQHLSTKKDPKLTDTLDSES